MCQFDNLSTYGCRQYDLTIHNLITIGPDRSHTHRLSPQLRKTICECGCYSYPSGDTVGFQTLLTWTLSICALTQL